METMTRKCYNKKNALGKSFDENLFSKILAAVLLLSASTAAPSPLAASQTSGAYAEKRIIAYYEE